MAATAGQLRQWHAMPSLDTNCLLRWLLDDVPAETQRVSRRLTQHPQLTISDVALIEVVFVLERVMKVSRDSIVAAISAFAAESAFAFDRSFWRSVADQYLAHPKLSVADVYLALEAARRGVVPLLTLDRKLASQMREAELA